MRAINMKLSFGIEDIYDDVNFYLNENEKTGIVGVNGAGKTTLFNVILKKIELDGGEIKWDKKRKIGYLPQEIEITSKEETVFEYLYHARPIEKLEKKQVELYEKISKSDSKDQKKLYKELEKIEDLLNYYEQYKAENILFDLIDEMHINSDLLDKKVKDLSGGQKSKVAFAHLLYSNPEVMLLDEPTNHLDLETREFVINYLKNYKGMILVISHDIDFLNAIAQNILYLDKTTHQMKVYKGNYNLFEKKKEEEKKDRELFIQKQEKEEKN